MVKLIALAFALTLLTITLSQPLRGNGRDGRPKRVPPGSRAFRRRRNRKCNLFFRELDGTCTNVGKGDAKVYGSTGRPQFSYFDEINDLSVFSGLKSAREISNVVFSQSEDIFNTCGVSEIAVFFGQFLDHTYAASPETHDDFPIPQSSQTDETGSQFLRNLGITEFPFTRSERVAVEEGSSEERASNALTSATDLANVYGPTEARNDKLRVEEPVPQSERGDLKVDKSFASLRDLLPRNVDELTNAPTPNDKDLFVAGDFRANEHPILASLHTLFVREHNRLAKELRTMHPLFDDERVYQMAKRINEIQYQKIIFEEWFPRITGRDLKPYSGFKPKTDLTISLTFSTAAYRVGHTMVGPQVKFVDKDSNTPNPTISLDLEDAFFNAVRPITTNGIDGFLKGAMLSRAQEVDTQVVDGLRNHLFRDVEALQGALDLVSLNIQRGRDHGLPMYNELREKFFRPKATCFHQITTNAEVRSKLEQVYDTPDDVEAYVGLLAEDHLSGSSFGPTMWAVWEAEFTHLRDGDWFYFRNTASITKTLQKHPRVKRILRERGFEVFRRIILDNTDISPEELPEKMFLVDVSAAEKAKCGLKTKRVPPGFLATCS